MDLPADLKEIDVSDFLPACRSRSNTWPLVTKTESVMSKPPTSKKAGSRKNAWGNLSYANLITTAIESSPGKRMTLAQIYDWMVQHVPFFHDKGNSNSSAGWKNSIRHNLSLHPQFTRVLNEGAGKSSWWIVNPAAKPSHGHRRPRLDRRSLPTPTRRSSDVPRRLAELTLEEMQPAPPNTCVLPNLSNPRGGFASLCADMAYSTSGLQQRQQKQSPLNKSGSDTNGNFGDFIQTGFNNNNRESMIETNTFDTFGSNRMEVLEAPYDSKSPFAEFWTNETSPASAPPTTTNCASDTMPVPQPDLTDILQQTGATRPGMSDKQQRALYTGISQSIFQVSSSINHKQEELQQLLVLRQRLQRQTEMDVFTELESAVCDLQDTSPQPPQEQKQKQQQQQYQYQQQIQSCGFDADIVKQESEVESIPWDMDQLFSVWCN